MYGSLHLTLKTGASLVREANGQSVIEGPAGRVALGKLSPGTVAVLGRIAGPGDRDDRMRLLAREIEGEEGEARWRECLCHLDEQCLILRSVRQNGVVLVTLESTTSTFQLPSPTIQDRACYVLSRFAYAHREDSGLVLETPLVGARLVLRDWRAVVLLHALASPMRSPEMGEQLATLGVNLPVEAMRELLTLFLATHIVDEVGNEESGDPDCYLRTWEFHDLLFHTRSRAGRHDHPAGATFRFAGSFEPPAALKSPMSGDSVELYRPDLDRLEREDLPFSLVLEARGSVREYAETPLSLQLLGEFLYRVARVADYETRRVQTPRGPIDMQFALRPYPGGGALHELELYVAINRCEDLEAGLYYYDPLGHRLVRLRDRTPEVEELLTDAGYSTGIQSDRLQVLIVITARFERTTWKYASMAYNVILKDVGVLYQTMYLVATAMGLAPCGVGYGDSDLFARAAGTNYYAETSVGEFLLGTKT